MTTGQDLEPMIHHYSHARKDERALKRKLASSGHLEDADVGAAPRGDNAGEVADSLAFQRPI